MSLQNPGYMKDSFHIIIETLHAPGAAVMKNVSLCKIFENNIGMNNSNVHQHWIEFDFS